DRLGGYDANGLFQLALHAHHFGKIDTFSEVLVLTNRDVVHIERKHHLVFGDGYGGVGPQGVPYAQLVKGIAIGSGDVRDHHVGGQQLLIHRHIDGSGMNNFVGPFAIEPRRDGRGLNDVVIGLVEIDYAPSGIIRLLAKTHNYKTNLLFIHVVFRFEMSFYRAALPGGAVRVGALARQIWRTAYAAFSRAMMRRMPASTRSSDPGNCIFCKIWLSALP